MNSVLDCRAEREGSRLAAIALAAPIYAALGLLGLSFAIAPGYASPIFPASGFAVAILLRSNRRAWPGIWLGSFALNAIVAWREHAIAVPGLAAAAGIACGAVLQALAARRLILRAAQEGWQTLEMERDIVRCLTLAGPVACLISASVGVGVLYLAGLMPGAECLYAWWNWWSGDTLGVLVLLPLSQTLLCRNRMPWRGRLTTLALPMTFALGLVGGVYYAVAQWELERQRADVGAHGENLVRLLEQRFIAHQEALSALRRLLEVTPDMTYGQFEHFTRITLKDNPDIFALSVNAYVTRAQRKAFEREMAGRAAASGFEIRERDSQKRLVRAADRAEYVVVAYIAPLEGNRPAVGYDINSEAVRHAAIVRAKTSGAPSVTAPIHLVQENRERVGLLLLHPAYRLVPVSDGTAREAELSGFAVGVIKVDEMVQIATRDTQLDGLVLYIDDAEAPADNSPLYRSGAIDVLPKAPYVWQKRVYMADRAWIFRLFPTAEFMRRQSHWMPLAVGAGGLTLAALLQVLLLVTTGRTSIVQRIVSEQTAELQAKSSALEDRNAQLNALFSLSPDAFVAFAPDGRVKFANPAFQVMTGICNVEIVNHDDETLDRALRARCENPEAFAGVASFFAVAKELPAHKILTLRTPRHAVLQIVGVRSESSSVSRILYLREITREAEVDRMKSEFLSHAAHELRTPMTSIFGFSELLMENDLDEETRRDLLETIHRQTKWLIDIINELLDLSRIETRRGQDLKLSKVGISALVRDTVADMAIDPARWPTTLELPADETYVLADAAKLRQALTNVLGNAVKYSPDGGAIRVAVAERPDAFGIVASDNGIGMTREELSHLGERFWRADTTGKTPGTGLGMAIVKEILALLGGTVEVDSIPGAGTTVTLWIPAARSEWPG